MAGKDHHVCVHVALQELFAGVTCSFLVHAEDCTEVRHHALDRMMHDVAAENGFGAIGFCPHGIVPDGVAFRRFQPQ